MNNHRPLFFSAAAFNVCASLPFLLAPDTVAPIMGMELNTTARVFLHVLMVTVLSFGGVYALIGHDPRRYRLYIPLGAFLKLIFVVVFWAHALAGHVGFGAPLLTLVDLFYAILFLRYYQRSRSAGTDFA